ncbi:MAG: carbon monoxide dehydrogenase, partial [Proteobacteria bacterium]|nr:carbon monoxide dehydrogenase [Pseudomonadota bacterium]
TAEFAKNLEARLDHQAAAAAAGEAAPRVSAPARLDAGALLWSVMWRRVKAFFARLFGG